MGKHKDSRKTCIISKRNEQASKLPAISHACSQTKTVGDRHINDEIELLYGSKKIDSSLKKELDRFPLLAKAVFLGCERAVDELLEAGENVNVQTLDGSTPLMIAVEQGHTTLLHKLLKKGADVRIIRKDGMNALMIAVSKNENRAFAILWSHLNKTGHWQLNQSDSCGNTLLTLAAERGNLECIMFLVYKGGLEVDRQTREGRTALMLAVRRSHKGIVQYLVESGASVVMEDNYGGTALCSAYAHEQMDIAKLLQKDFDFKLRDEYVRGRINLLTKFHYPSLCPTENYTFFKKVLFRVILKVKKAMRDGVFLLLRHGVFEALVRLADSNRNNCEIQRLVFHLSACLMYTDEEATAELVLADMARSFIIAGGTEYCIGALVWMEGVHRWSALLPVHASCVGCPTGICWLRDNLHCAAEYSAGFRYALPWLKYWTNGQQDKAERVLAKFEEFIISGLEQGGDPRLERNTHVKSSCAADDAENLNTSDVLADKRKTTEWAWKHDYNLFPVFKKVPDTLNPSPYTGYADALKKNLKGQMEDKIKLYANTTTSKEITKATKLTMNDYIKMKNTQLTQNIPKIMHHAHDESLNITSSTCLEINSNNNLIVTPVLKDFAIDDGMNFGKKDYIENISDSYFHDNFKYCNQVPSLAEPAKTISIYTVRDSCVFQNNYDIPSRWCYGENQNNNHANSKANTVCSALKKDECEDTAKPLVGPSGSGWNYWEYDSKLKLTVEDEENLCLKFNNLVLDDDVTPEKQKDWEDSRFRSEKLISLYRENYEKFLVGKCSTVSDLNFVHRSKEGSVVKQNEFLIEQEETYTSSRRTYSDVARGDDKNRINERNVSGDTSSELGGVTSAQNSNGIFRRMYSDVTRVRMRQIMESADNLDKITGNEMKNITAEGVTEECVKKGIKRMSIDELSVKRNFEQLDIETLKDAHNKKRHLWGIHNSFHEEISNTGEEYYILKSEDFPRLDKPIFQENKHQSDKMCSAEQKSIDSSFKPDLESTEMQNLEKSMLTLKSIAQENQSNNITIDGITQQMINLEKVRVSPLTYKWKLGVLQKYVSYLNRVISHCLHSTIFSPETRIISNHITVYGDFVKRLLLKHGGKTKHENTHFLSNSVVERKSNCFGAEPQLGRLEEVKLSLTNNFLNLSKVKDVKIENTVQNKTLNFFPEYKRQTAKEKVLMHRRFPNSGTSTEYSQSQVGFLETGYVPRFISCNINSKWFPILTSLESCVPLSQHLLPPEERPVCISPSNVRSIITRVGKVVFGTEPQHTLREGSFGSYVGIVDENGKPVAVRQISTATMFNDITELYISSKHLLKHKNLTIFYDVQVDLQDRRISFVYELCEFSLPQYLKTCHSNKQHTLSSHFRKFLVVDLLEGVRYLHQKKVVHGFLKPSNLVVTMNPRLKLTDYHLLDIMPLEWGIRLPDPENCPIGSSISKYCWRPTELIKAENMVDARTSITAASDVQMCGMLTFYLLSGGRHPFGNSDSACQENIKMGTMVEGLQPEDVESRDLVCEMVKGIPGDRPTIEAVLSRPNRAADDFRKNCIEARSWMPYVQRNLLKYMSNYSNKNYQNDFSGLLKFAVDLQDNFEGLPSTLKNSVRHPAFYILLRFPTTFMSVYHVIRNSALLRTQIGLQEFI